MENRRVGKVMEKMSHTWVATELSSTRNFKLGEWFRSDVFTSPGGDSFRLYCYPKGRSNRDYIDEYMCISLNNEGPTDVQLTFSMKILHQLTGGKISLKNIGSSMFGDRQIYRRVATLTPKSGCEVNCFPQHELKDGDWSYTLRNRLKIRVTIGIFRDAPSPQSDHRLVFIKTADGTRFYAEDSVLRARCPTLVPEDYSMDVQLPLIKRDVFIAVLWYIYHNDLHRDDQVALCHSNLRDPDSMGVKMIAAARELGMTDLMRILRSLYRFGSIIFLQTFFAQFRGKAIRNCKEANKMVVIKSKSTSSAGRVEVSEGGNEKG